MAVTECEQRVEEVTRRVAALEQWQSRMELEHERRETAFDRHMEKEEQAFERFYDELRGIRDQITGIVTTALRDRNTLEKEIGQRYVSKNEARLVYAVVTTTFVVALWFVTYVQDNSADAKLEAMAERIVKELRK